MKRSIHSLLMLTLFLASFMGAPESHAKLKLFTTLPDLAFLAAQVAGDRADVEALLSGTENPHFVDARPDLIRKAAGADIVCAVGLELEAGWLPRVLQKSGNAKIQTGGAGFCELARSVTILQRPTGPVDRSMGDVHPGGNPHFWISPLALAEGGKALLQVLEKNDPEGKPTYEKNLAAFQERMSKLVSELKPGVTAALKKAAVSKPVIEYHQEFVYLFSLYGIDSYGSIEERPGVPPSAQRLGQVALQSKAAKVVFALSAPYAPLSLIHKFTELSGIPHATVPTSTRREQFKDYEKLHREVVETLIRGLDGTLSHR